MAREEWNRLAPSRDEQRRQKRMAVLQTSARLFTQFGFERTTLDDIAAELNVSKRTLYYYVKSKNDILSECTQLALRQLDRAVRDIAASGQTPLRRIEALLRRYMSLAADDLGACLILTRPDSLRQENREILLDGRRKFDFALRGLIREGIDDGSIAPCEPKIATAAIFGAFNWVLHWHPERSKEAYDEIAGQFLTFLITGLKAR